MPIAGVVIIINPARTEDVLNKLDMIPGITTYGVHKENHIIAVFEGDTSKSLEKLSKRVQEEIPGILGVYPTYVNFEDELENQN